MDAIEQAERAVRDACLTSVQWSAVLGVVNAVASVHTGPGAIAVLRTQLQAACAETTGSPRS
jgi:fatty acid-binding protein DegV